jgi:transcriptional activator of cad operon
VNQDPPLNVVRPDALRPDPHRVLRIGEWTVNGALDEISSGGTVVKLEPRAMRLLLHLAAYAGRVVGVTELLEQVWPNVVVTQQSVYATIAELRRALGDSADAPQYIATVARKGYRLVARVERLASGPTGVVADITPSRPPLSVVATPAKSATHWRWAGAGGLLLAVLSVGLLLARHTGISPAITSTRSPADANPGDKSVAVLPFLDLSERKDQQYFADGMTEEIVGRLSRISGLQVAARTSTFSLKTGTEDVRTIAQRLLVANVLEGSVQRAGQRLHVTAQLLRADTGYHLWSQTYDRAVDDIFAVQDEVSTAVAKALKVSLSPASQSTVGGTRNAEANDLYLEARFNAGQLSSEGASTASGLLARALTLDPNFAAAWALLSRVRMSQFRHRLAPAAQLEATRGLAREAAQRAVALVPDLPEAHLELVFTRRNPTFTPRVREWHRKLASPAARGRPIVRSGRLVSRAYETAQEAQSLEPRARALPHRAQWLLSVPGALPGALCRARATRPTRCSCAATP